jgi:hypothetical protein
MGFLRDLILTGDGPARVRDGGAAVADIKSRLEAGEAVARLIGPQALSLADLVAAIAWIALGDETDQGPSLTQSRPAHPRLLGALSEPAWVAAMPSVPHRARLCLSAGLLQIHDFWDASHDAAQRADDLGEREFSAYWHAIAHRREPDSGNAAYWFRRVGTHSIYKSLASEARSLLEKAGDPRLADRLAPDGKWNATAMTQICTQSPVTSSETTLVRRVQRLEMWLLLEATCAAITG